MQNLEEIIKQQKELVNRDEKILKLLEELQAYREQHNRLCDYYKVNSIEEIYGKAIDDFFDKLEKYEESDSWIRLKMSSIYYISEELKKI